MEAGHSKYQCKGLEYYSLPLHLYKLKQMCMPYNIAMNWSVHLLPQAHVFALALVPRAPCGTSGNSTGASYSTEVG